MKVQSRFGVTIPDNTNHEPVTVNDGDTVNFTASGTDNQTITAEVKISATGGNIISANADGIYASASGADNWGSQVIDHDGLSISSGDGTALDPLLVSPLTSVTYAQLAALISGSDLIPGHKYLITDYQTVHTIPGTADTNTGATEPLIVTAISAIELAPVAYSTSFPNDIVYYDYRNNSTVVGSTKGFIYRRIDTLENTDIPFDWRAVKFRRWQIDVDTVFDIGATYALGDVVLDANNSTIWISLINANIGNTPVDTDGYWRRFEWTNLSYVSHSSVSFSLITGVSAFTVPVTALYVDTTSFSNPKNVKMMYKRISGLDILASNNSVFDSLLDVYIDVLDMRNNHINGIINSHIQASEFRNNSVGFFTKNSIYGEFSYNSLTSITETHSKYVFINNSIRTSEFNNITFNFATNRQGSNIANAFANNNLHGTFTSNHIDKIGGDNFRYGNFLPGSVVTTTSFLSATHMFDNYTKEILQRSDNNPILRYTDGSNVTTFAAVNA